MNLPSGAQIWRMNEAGTERVVKFQNGALLTQVRENSSDLWVDRAAA